MKMKYNHDDGNSNKIVEIKKELKGEKMITKDFWISHNPPYCMHYEPKTAVN